LSENKKFCFIINPVAGGKRKAKFVKHLEKSFARKSDYQIIYSEYAGHASEIAKSESEKGRETIVAVGGDGTINEIGAALKGTSTALAVVPFGSGNGFARHFNIPLNYKKALEVIFKGESRFIDSAIVNNKDFFCTSGIGFDAEIGHLFANSKKRGFLNYGISFLKAFYGYQSKKYQLNIDGVEISYEAFLINVANISQYGNHFFIAPEASASDGLLNLVILKKFPKWKVIGLIFRSYFKTIHNSSYIIDKKVCSLKIRTSIIENSIHIDGEPETIKGDLKYNVIKDSLKIIC